MGRRCGSTDADCGTPAIWSLRPGTGGVEPFVSLALKSLFGWCVRSIETDTAIGQVDDSAHWLRLQACPTYDQSMSVRSHIIGAAIFAVLAGATAPVHATAEPSSMCSYVVSAPRADIGPGGAKVVTATMAVIACPDTWQPTKSAVCLAPSGKAGTCVPFYGWGPGRVNIPATSDDGGYLASGQGCARLNSEATRCVAVAPAQANIGRI